MQPSPHIENIYYLHFLDFLLFFIIKGLGAFSFVILNIQFRRLYHLHDLSDSNPSS